MIKQHLRQVSLHELEWNQRAAYWADQGIKIESTFPPLMESVFLRISSRQGWNGIIDLREWISYALPDVANMANSAFTTDELLVLFNECTGALTVPPLWMPYYCDGICSLNELGEVLGCVKHTFGTLWLSKLPEPDHVGVDNENIQKFQFNSIPVRINFELGRSSIRRCLLDSIKYGDVLLINNLRLSVSIGGLCIFSYRQKKGDIVIENIDDEMNFLEASDDTQLIYNRKDIPIQLTFVLEQREVTLDKLDKLKSGDVLKYDEGVEKRVMVIANGVTIAQGELIWADERLGIQIDAIYNEKKYAK